ncbi:MAG: MBL fold metallo-hydrolase, partial [Leclercia adecarboxylata]|nr:MBL fold metallo-hydrolase [Leclercia adecarboxylata]
MAWSNPWYNASLAHHTPQGFRNTDGAEHQPGDVERWQKERKAAGLPKPPEQGYDQFIRQWWQPVTLNTLEEDGVWWLGHASLLLRLNGKYILTDPAFSRRASPVPFAG